MHCLQNRKSQHLPQSSMPAFAAVATHEAHPALKSEYVRKIATDACLVGSLPNPRSSRVPPGLIRSNESYPCTFTCSSGFGGMKLYPYSEYRLCECGLDLRRLRHPKVPQQQQQHQFPQQPISHKPHRANLSCACTVAPFLPRQSNSVSALQRNLSSVPQLQNHVRQTSAEVVLRRHHPPPFPSKDLQQLPPQHQNNHLSRRDHMVVMLDQRSSYPNPQFLQHLHHHQTQHQNQRGYTNIPQNRQSMTADPHACAMLREVNI